MDIGKIILLLTAFFFLLSCGKKEKDVILQSDYDELMSEYMMLKDENTANKKAIMDQASILNKTLVELSEISGHTEILKNDIEIGRAKITQAQSIRDNLLVVKEKLESYQAAIKGNAELKKTIATLQMIIAEKEMEITRIYKTIEQQNQIIQHQKVEIDYQKSHISDQNELIKAKNKELTQALQDQTELIYQAAIEFERFANENIDVSRKKNQEKVMQYKKQILRKAAEYYSIAAQMGHRLAAQKTADLSYLLN